MSGSFRPTWNGVAVVCCIHDREKRQVTTERQVAELGARAGYSYDTRQHKIHRCACCDNLFVDPTDEPGFCLACRPARQRFPLAGALPDPIGVVDG